MDVPRSGGRLGARGSGNLAWRGFRPRPASLRPGLPKGEAAAAAGGDRAGQRNGVAFCGANPFSHRYCILAFFSPAFFSIQRSKFFTPSRTGFHLSLLAPAKLVAGIGAKTPT